VAIRAKSLGSIRLASSNTHVPPIIDAGYLSNPSDLATLREGIKLGRLLGRRPEWGEYLGEEVYPGPLVQTDEEIDEYIRNSVHTANAMTGTCKMGLHRDCVVGTDLKVFGVNRVRVCDSSIIPIIPGGQTATPTVMIAERAAAMIIADAIPIDTSSTLDHTSIQAEDGPEQPEEEKNNEVEKAEEIESTTTFISEQSDDLEQYITEDSSQTEVESSPLSDIVIEESLPNINVEDEFPVVAQSDADSLQISDVASISTEDDNTTESSDLAPPSPSE
jgi:GMC oxidoreductase